MKLLFLTLMFFLLTNIMVRGQEIGTLKKKSYPMQTDAVADTSQRENIANPLKFTIHQNFFLVPEAWGMASHVDIIDVLDNVISNFYSNIDTSIIIKRTVLVINSTRNKPPTDYPQFIRLKGFAVIFLTPQDRYWCQFSYQFSHELCHSVIDIDFPPAIDKFGWFEESICELASLFTMDRMATTWIMNSPHKNWNNYAHQLRQYVNMLLQREESQTTVPFGQWLRNNLETLYKDRVNRQLNNTVAIQLLPVFKMHPQLWKTIQYLKEIKVTNVMSFTTYLKEWKNKLPPNLTDVYKYIEDGLK